MKSSPTKKQRRFRSKYGPWAVVTGASDGIGREVAFRVGEAGLNLVLVARRRERLEELASDLAERYQVDTRCVAVDLGENPGVERIVDETKGLDVGLLVACAGFGTSGPFIAASLANELAMVDVNCRAVLALSHAFGQRFAARGRGGIVLMSSIVAFQGVPRTANYAATKAYVQTLAEGLRLELAPDGVDVLAAAPGPVASGFGERANLRMGQALKPTQVGQTMLDALGRSATVRPGWLSKLLGYSLNTLPRAGRSRILAGVMRGMTKHQGDNQHVHNPANRLPVQEAPER